MVDKISGAGGEAIFLHQDVSLEESWPGVIEATERRFGRLDVMVANAGIGILCKAVEMSLADWRRQTAVNLDGAEFDSLRVSLSSIRKATLAESPIVIYLWEIPLKSHCSRATPFDPPESAPR